MTASRRWASLARMSKDTSVEIRRLKRADVDSLVGLLAQSFKDEIALARVPPDGMRGQLTALSVAGRGPLALGLRMLGMGFEFWVAAQGSDVVGCYALHGSSPMTLSTLAVHPGARRLGVGRALVLHAFSRARSLRSRQVVLEVLEENRAAVALYTRLGMLEYDRKLSYNLVLTPQQYAHAGWGRITLGTLRASHLDAWPRVLAASVPAHTVQFSSLYRSQYLTGRVERWFEGLLPPGRTLRRAVLLDDRIAGFACVRKVGESCSTAEILPPLYLDEASPWVGEILTKVTCLAGETGSPHGRLYVSGWRPESRDAAEALGYAFERAWLYLFKDL